MKNAKMRRIMLHSYLMNAALLLAAMVYGAGGLRSTALRVEPRLAQRGRAVTLACDYAAPRGVYSVKWYKEHQEFYRYSPLEEPPTRLRPVPAVHVDMARSNATHVVLTRASAALSGNYSCEVIQNAPSYPHSIAFARLDVVGAGGLRATELRITPPAVPRGGDATLACLYELTDAPLYSVKWYRGRHEFYRYSPAELPATKIFPFAGINVDLARSNQSQVVLQRVSFGLAGNFSCEVTADAPSFATSIVSGAMEVVVLPPAPPVISTERRHYAPGDVLRARCSAGPARPAPALAFFLNDEPVAGEAAAGDAAAGGAAADGAEGGLQQATLAVSVQLWPAHYERGAPVLRCRAALPPLYRADAALALHAPNGDPKIERVTSPGAAAPLLSCRALLVINAMIMLLSHAWHATCDIH